jgi:hypothetical protein
MGNGTVTRVIGWLFVADADGERELELEILAGLLKSAQATRDPDDLVVRAVRELIEERQRLRPADP